jgi:hypothetical protein
MKNNLILILFMTKKSSDKWSRLVSVFLLGLIRNWALIQIRLLLLHKLIYLNTHIFLLVVSLHGRHNKRVSTLEIEKWHTAKETIKNLFTTLMNAIISVHIYIYIIRLGTSIHILKKNMPECDAFQDRRGTHKTCFKTNTLFSVPNHHFRCDSRSGMNTF